MREFELENFILKDCSLGSVTKTCLTTRERKRDRDRQRQRDRQTDKDRQTDTERRRQRQAETERNRDIEKRLLRDQVQLLCHQLQAPVSPTWGVSQIQGT